MGFVFLKRPLYHFGEEGGGGGHFATSGRVRAGLVERALDGVAGHLCGVDRLMGSSKSESQKNK